MWDAVLHHEAAFGLFQRMRSVRCAEMRVKRSRSDDESDAENRSAG